MLLSRKLQVMITSAWNCNFWGYVNWELWLGPQSYLPVGNKRPSDQSCSGRYLHIPKRFCYIFHKGVVCSSWAFKYNCDGSHRASNCIFVSPVKKPQQNLCPLLLCLQTPIVINRFLTFLFVTLLFFLLR